MKDKLILSQNITQSFDISESGRNNNTLILATTGGGKTVSVVYPQLLHTFSNSIVLTYSKQEDMYDYLKLLSNRDYDIQFLDFAQPQNSSTGFDLMEYIADTQDIRDFATKIIETYCGGRRSNDHYWDDAAKELLCGEIALVFSLYQMREDDVECEGLDIIDYEAVPSFLNVLQVHEHLMFYETIGAGSAKSTLDNVFGILEDYTSRQGGQSQALLWFRSIRGLPFRTAVCIYSSLTTILNGIFTPTIRGIMGFKSCGIKKSLYIRGIADRKTAVFIRVSPYEKSNEYFTSIVYTTLFKQLFIYAQQLGGSLARNVHFICDDFACGCALPEFDRSISIMRACKMSVCILLQSESQLFAMYGERAATTIINNCDSIVYMGGMDIKTCKDISMRINRPFEEVMYMPPGKVWVIQKGAKGAALDDRFDTFHDEIWLKNINVHT